LLEKDIEDLPASTSARRLIVSHDGQDENPPGLFLFVESPKVREVGLFIGVKKLIYGLKIKKRSTWRFPKWIE
jgi:hypothetical protein